MTRKEAIKILKNSMAGRMVLYKDSIQATQMAINALEDSDNESLLSKACEWLMENIYNYSASGHGIQREQLIKDFKQAMKGGEE